MDGSIRVIKRDGSVESFVFSKLLSCIGNGFRSSGESDERVSVTSKGLTEAVYAYIEKKHPASSVSSDLLSELVELVLTQTGHTAASMAIKQHTQIRDQLRRWLRVAYPRRVDGCYVQRRWSKSRLVAYLLDKHALESTIARMIASRVEQLVFNCGLKVVTAGLVKAMAESELLAWGLLPGALAVKNRNKHRSVKKVEKEDGSVSESNGAVG